METGEESAKLLKWHEKLAKRAGLVRGLAAPPRAPRARQRHLTAAACMQGCIVRALTDRKTVMKRASGTSGSATYSDATR